MCRSYWWHVLTGGVHEKAINNQAFSKLPFYKLKLVIMYTYLFKLTRHGFYLMILILDYVTVPDSGDNAFNRNTRTRDGASLGSILQMFSCNLVKEKRLLERYFIVFQKVIAQVRSILYHLFHINITGAIIKKTNQTKQINESS